jgi:hypothetical protein
MEVSYFKKIVGGILLGCLLFIAACVTAGSTTGPIHQQEGPQYYDPNFWQMYQSSRGLG